MAARIDSQIRSGRCVSLRCQQIVFTQSKRGTNSDGRVPDVAARLEAAFDETTALRLSEFGFIALAACEGTSDGCFFDARSCHDAGVADAPEASLRYLFVLTRIAQYLKVIDRGLRDRGCDAAARRARLEGWLRDRVSNMDNPMPKIFARRPFRAAALTFDTRGETEHFNLRVEPHFRHRGARFTVSLVGILGP